MGHAYDAQPHAHTMPLRVLIGHRCAPDDTCSPPIAVSEALWHNLRNADMLHLQKYDRLISQHVPAIACTSLISHMDRIAQADWAA